MNAYLKSSWKCLKGGLVAGESGTPRVCGSSGEGDTRSKVLFENFCCRAVQLESGKVVVTHIRHDEEFCGMKAMVRALHGRLDFETQFVEIEGDFFTCSQEEDIGADK